MIDIPPSTRVGDLTPEMASQVNEGLSGEGYGQLAFCMEKRTWCYTSRGGFTHTLDPDAVVHSVWVLAEITTSAGKAPALAVAAGDKAALQRCISERSRGGYELKLSSCGVVGLFRVANAAQGRFKRAELTANGPAGYRLTGEDLAWLIARGHLMESDKWLEITDQGQTLVREMVAFAQGWEGGRVV